MCCCGVVKAANVAPVIDDITHRSLAAAYVGGVITRECDREGLWYVAFRISG